MDRRRSPWGVALHLSALLACGCVAGGEALLPDEAAEAARDAIVGGAVESGYPLVGALAVDYGPWGISAFCTATAVTPTVLLTAAHCLDAFEEMRGMDVVFYQVYPDGTRTTTSINVGSATREPGWGETWRGYTRDIGVALLRRPLAETVYPALRPEPLRWGDVGTDLVAVGFGVTGAQAEDSGTKRSIPMVLDRVYGDFFGLVFTPPEDWRGVCYGDSGGPTFVAGEDRDVQYGVHARTASESCGPGEDTSVGDFFETFVRGAVLSLDPTAEDCGDGVCTGLEDRDGCPADCIPHLCGDGVVDGPEVCDDGNVEGGDGCSGDCLSDESCGNGVVDGAAAEVCDDGNVEAGDGCSGDCLSYESCGNGVVDPAVGEGCDDGNLVDLDGCSSACEPEAECGNGLLEPGEACDDGNVEAGDGCSGDCLSDESCGNGVVDAAAGEGCDDGNLVDEDDCPADCGLPEDLDRRAAACGCPAASPSRAPTTLARALLSLL